MLGGITVGNAAAVRGAEGPLTVVAITLVSPGSGAALARAQGVSM
jgi:hypothetical protein